MKTLRLLLILPGLLALQSAFSQQTSHVTLSNQYPAAGETINLTYDPNGTALDGKKDINGIVYYLDNKDDHPAVDLTFKPDGKTLKTDLVIPADAKSFYIKLYSDDVVDNNNDAGYVYLIYKDQKPVQGAYATEAAMLMSGEGISLAKIKKLDNADGLAIYKKEFDLYPNSYKDYGAGYYRQLARSTNAEDLATVNNKISELEKSGSEKDLGLASDMLHLSNRRGQADSLSALIKQKYPTGGNALFEDYISFLKAKDLSKKDSIYNLIAPKYPKSDDKDLYQDILGAQLAGSYLEKGDMVNYEKYAAMLKNKKYLASALNNAAYEMAKNGKDLDLAAKLSKQSLDAVEPEITNPTPAPYRSSKQLKVSNQATYDMYADTYAFILFKQNKPKEALAYEQGVYDRNKPLDPEENEHYILILNAVGKYSEAKLIAESAVKTGKGSTVIKDELKKDYVKSKGSDKGFEPYLAALESDAATNAHLELAKQMINTPAPAFTLKDIDGNTVSLSDLKGKIVIVDFWATWCGPCKASFPGMQMAVNKYKDNPNVKFLFVDCWENGDNYTDGVKKFITDNKYTFHVLLDEKAADGRQAKVVSTFNVSGIPTKFIIDKNGNIRFKYVGYDGTPEKLVEEVSNMIDMTNNPNAATAGPKVSMNN